VALARQHAAGPGYRPIEQAFSKLNTWLRQAEARTRDALEKAIASALATITRADAHVWFCHCQYDLDRQALQRML
jgi:hypothetical protein